MKVLIVSTYDIAGGAARAAYRLHRALLEDGVESKMLVQIKRSADPTVIGPSSRVQKAIGLIRPYIDQLPVTLYRNRIKTLFSPSWLGFSNIVKKINTLKPDIVHLHWICGGLIRIEDLAKIKAPIVWSLHDNWAFTGGCHYVWDCEKYKNICGACPQLKSKMKRDLSLWVFKRKQKAFSKVNNFIIVGLSCWVTNLSKQSALFRNRTHITLPNLIDTELFKPIDKRVARKLWNLPQDRRLVLFGAVNATDDPRKGFDQLQKALKFLNTEDIEIVIFGNYNSPSIYKLKTYPVGIIHDDISLVTLYNAVDVTLVPSLQENLSNVIMESLSCGTPVVAFDIGGNRDLIDHKVNGYLAKPFDTQNLAKGIEWVLYNSNYEVLRQNARGKVLREFNKKAVVRKYIELYEEMLKGV